ncbi:hypothetical protein CDAR_604811 [Caerostris darwini]|uniref:Uncharacterized protein n=1 Tax=Caerostris darwini TaxID=1538125 RepID=A0AAV4VRW8_9ARAC|nr:hypothetical protein CDAR_604811 [Caerostris darwini]
MQNEFGQSGLELIEIPERVGGIDSETASIHRERKKRACVRSRKKNKQKLLSLANLAVLTSRGQHRSCSQSSRSRAFQFGVDNNPGFLSTSGKQTLTPTSVARYTKPTNRGVHPSRRPPVGHAYSTLCLERLHSRQRGGRQRNR